jgi:hypothetical protein
MVEIAAVACSGLLDDSAVLAGVVVLGGFAALGGFVVSDGVDCRLGGFRWVALFRLAGYLDNPAKPVASPAGFHFLADWLEGYIPVDFPAFPVGYPEFPVDCPEYPVDFPAFPVGYPEFPVDCPEYPVDFPAFPVGYPGFPVDCPAFPVDCLDSLAGCLDSLVDCRAGCKLADSRSRVAGSWVDDSANCRRIRDGCPTR